VGFNVKSIGEYDFTSFALCFSLFACYYLEVKEMMTSLENLYGIF
jgi:hypothetical protein